MVVDIKPAVLGICILDDNSPLSCLAQFLGNCGLFGGANLFNVIITYQSLINTPLSNERCSAHLVLSTRNFEQLSYSLTKPNATASPPN